jgi:hypothetical protein
MNKTTNLSSKSISNYSTHETKKENVGTIFSRGVDSTKKLLLSLKSFFLKTQASHASAAVTQAVPQATTQSIKAETKRVRLMPDHPRDRIRMAYRGFLDPHNGMKPLAKTKGPGYERKVSFFDSAVGKILKNEPLKPSDLQVIEEELPKLKNAVANNTNMSSSLKKQLLLDLENIEKN